MVGFLCVYIENLHFQKLFLYAAHFNRCDFRFFNGRTEYSQNCVVIYFAHQTDTIERNVFVGLMNGSFFPAKFRTERATAFQCTRIRTATDCDGLFVFARRLIVYVHQRSNHSALRIIVKGSLIIIHFIISAVSGEFL